MTTPYRLAATQPAVPTWQRLAVRIAPSWCARRWQWARRAIGGRWACVAMPRVWEFTDYPWRDIWVMTAECPAKWGEPPTVSSDLFYQSLFTAGWYRTRLDHQRACTCEVWS